MKRRPFIKLLGSNLIGLPLVMGSTSIFEPKANWAPWLAHLRQDAALESIHELWMANGLPPEPASVRSGEFSKTSGQFFLYQKRQYCFRVFEKQHPQAGTIDLLIPFWKKQKNGTWVQIACLSAFGLEALAKACQQDYTATQVLPIEAGQAGSFVNALGEVQIQTQIQLDNKAQTQIKISQQGKIVWQNRFFSTQCLNYY
ncbi:hypothetical protein [Haliscomenobacter sp.]|uniref:hypothetical protein n=1 Tax=Haliscomenobacter sp. TaxID=2717303 RepID=UPI003594686D